MSFLFSPLRILGEYIFGEWDSTAIARGVAFGTLCGLVPKWNLSSLVLVLSLLIFRLNLVFAIAAAAVASILAGLLDPLADRLGETILESPLIGPVGERLFSLPLMPWTMLDNSVVLGQLIIGLLLFFPICKIVKLMLGKNDSKNAAKNGIEREAS